MGLIDWVRSFSARRPPPESASPSAPASPSLAAEGAVLAGLNFKTAIDAHMKWKVRLESCLSDDNKESLQVDVVSRDDQCVLGKWIYGAGGQHFGHLPEFQEMKTEHARFHQCAGEVLNHCIAGDKEGASRKLLSGDYPRTSERVKLHLARLYVQVADKL
jgi:hypothetical protein